MAATIGYAALDIIPSLRNVRSQIEKQAAAPMTAAGRTAGARFGDTAGKEAGDTFRGRFSNALRGFGPVAGLLGGAAIVQGFRDVVGAASEAEQSVGGVQAVFGDYARQVLADSKTAAEGLGLSANAYRELVTISGALLKNKGLEDFAQQGRQLVEVGADLAAQYGGPTTQAVEALNAALRGESDPIERYAISLNETAVNAVLAANGQDKLTGAALEQAKTQARLNLIMQQSADAQGAFARESETLAGQQARLSAEWANLRTELGTQLLPATAEFVGFLRNQGIPALETTADVVTTIVGAVGDLPTPVLGAAAAFTALKVATRFGAGDAARSGIGRLSSSLDTLRLRAMLAKDEFRAARGGTLELQGAYGRLTPAAGRLTSSFRALKVGASGATSALSRGLRGAVGLLGGPWGIALTAGAAALTHFYAEQKEAEQRVADLTESLDAQTGALTEQSRALIFKTLQDAGAISAANDLGISLDRIRLAAEGNAPVLRSLNAELDHLAASKGVSDGIYGTAGATDTLRSVNTLRDALSGQNAEVDKAIRGWKQSTEFMGDSAGATDGVTTSTDKYRSSLQKATGALRRLKAAEDDRRLANIQERRDQIALRETIRAAREEARKGKKVLDDQSKAADANMSALLDLADQWNNSTPKVRNARGAYMDMRKEFIKLGDQMNGPNGTRKDAEKLADALLTIPKKAPVKFQSEGFQKRMAEIERLKKAAANLEVQLNYQGLVKAVTGANPGAQTNYNINVDKVVANDTDDIAKNSRRRALGGF